MSDYDDRGKVALWEPKSDNPKAPVLSGHVYAHRDLRAGEKVDIALWRNESNSDRAPVLRGEIRDPYQGTERQQQRRNGDAWARKPPAPEGPPNDDIPF